MPFPLMILIGSEFHSHNKQLKTSSILIILCKFDMQQNLLKNYS
jgi:hypothetical protein